MNPLVGGGSALAVLALAIPGASGRAALLLSGSGAAELLTALAPGAIARLSVVARTLLVLAV